MPPDPLVLTNEDAITRLDIASVGSDELMTL
jgi:hypothetical protein